MTRFPAVRLSGDKDVALTHLPLGKTEMLRTKEVRSKMGVSVFGRTTVVDDTTTIYTLVSREQDIIFIHTDPPPGISLLDVEPIPEEEQERYVGIYSGLAYSHQISNDFVAGPPDLGAIIWIERLREFNPTLSCRSAFFNDFTDGVTYQPVTRLGIEANSKVWNSGSHSKGFLDSGRFDFSDGKIAQTNLVHACQYSGPLARACSLALGNGTFNIQTPDTRAELLSDDAHSTWVTKVKSDGFQIAYDFHGSRTHNICKDNLGDWWLIQLSATSGIVARPLPVIKTVRVPEDSVEIAALDEFRGLPSGEAFPLDQYLEEELEDGNYIRMMDNNETTWTKFRNESVFSDGAGWVFNDDGTQGRVCTYKYNASGWLVVSYWRVDFVISVDSKGNVTGDASIQRIAEDIAATPGKWDFTENKVTTAAALHRALPVVFYDPDENKFEEFDLPISSAMYSDTNKFGEIPEVMNVVVWVGWIDDDWHEIRYKAENIGEWPIGKGVRLLDIATEWEWTGPLPISQGGSEVDPSLPHIKIFMPESPYFQEADRIEHLYRKEILSNEPLPVAHQRVRLRGYVTRVISGRLIHSLEVDNTQAIPYKDVYFITVPYNRNAYYLYDYEHQIGNRTRDEKYFTTYATFLDSGNYGSPRNSSPESTCSNPTYPYPRLDTEEELSETQFAAPVQLPGFALYMSSQHGEPSSIYISNVNEIFDEDTCHLSGSDNNVMWILTIDDMASCLGDLDCLCDNLLFNRWMCSSWNTYQWTTGPTDNPGGDWLPMTIRYMRPYHVRELSHAGGAVWTHTVQTGYSHSTIENMGVLGSIPAEYALVDQDTVVDPERTLNISIVAQGLGIKDLGEVPDDDVQYVDHNPPPLFEDAASTYWCQTTVLGEFAMIYADPTVVVRDEGEWPKTRYGMDSEGVMPALPTEVPSGDLQYAKTDDNEMYRYLSFVGVNGP